ncbi:hypothetical protein GKC30_12770 [Pseudodesulfovibrio sp. F-1]|uniref:Putative heavy-metal chelation domain-containing protein n=1 Tax=Pseudodesulfovibrio alkaliphilus TaxID=2661613 RepID=A0A7K1KQY5_9BACT|nr:DUF364 domain-containing protein [Pseudodesulfovibrio alkaliphilus]MUM78509.1 hypothetical protein [Pseudodesulfovibrio alkaliphilus]
MESTLKTVWNKGVRLWADHGLMEEEVMVSAGPLTVQQAIGDPGGGDYPIQQGKERLVEASFRGFRGQAFTDHYGHFCGTLAEIANLPLTTNYHRAVFIATLNAVMNALGKVGGTIHCKDCGPERCARAMPDHIRRTYGVGRVTIVGFQPAMAERLGGELDIRLLDLDPDNIGQVKRGVLVEGPESAAQALDWAELLVVTGTTLVNDSIGRFLVGRPVLFYGTTIAAAASLMQWDRYCPQSG